MSAVADDAAALNEGRLACAGAAVAKALVEAAFDTSRQPLLAPFEHGGRTWWAHCSIQVARVEVFSTPAVGAPFASGLVTGDATALESYVAR